LLHNEYMSAEKTNNILQLIKSSEDQDIIYQRLKSVCDLINKYEEDDPLLDIVQNKVIEAIDWYERFCEQNGFRLVWENDSAADEPQTGNF
jgi:hypothetical protein